MGLPYDRAIPTRRGARQGPGALRAALTRFSGDPGAFAWPADARLTDFGDIDLRGLTVADAHERVEAVLDGMLGRVAWLVAIGGDHGLTYPVFRALSRARGGAWGLITLDAHHDVRPWTPDAISSGTPFRRCLELGAEVLAPERLVQIGIRPFANEAAHRAWCEERGVAIHDVAAVRERGWKAVTDEALARASDGADHLYVSLDLDVIDQAEAPGTSAAGPDGLAAGEVLGIFERLCGHPGFAGGDIMELSPRWDPGGLTARLAARALLGMAIARMA